MFMNTALRSQVGRVSCGKRVLAALLRGRTIKGSTAE